MVYMTLQGNTHSSHISLEDGAMHNHAGKGNAVCCNDFENMIGSLDELETYELICI